MGGIKPDDLLFNRWGKFTIDAPSIQKRRGAIRGVSIRFNVWSGYGRKEYSLVNPPKGMKIVGRADEGMEGRDGVTIQWDVPRDAQEGKSYDITVNVKKYKTREKTITFPIKVPKTKPIQTKLVNNELIVTDKNSNLYGMKMRGHSGEDISKMRLRSVAYRDVWKKKIKKWLKNSTQNYYSFIVYNKPKQADIDLPFSKDIVTTFLRYRNIIGSFWTNIDRLYTKDKQGNLIPERNEYDNGGNKVYLLVIEKDK